MSRETDSPSSGPHGRGGAAYPSGTPPYGTPTASDAGADAGRSAARPEERKTETTLTTRIRINIPGSRPIPPVVMRRPVGDAEGAADHGQETAAAERPAPAPGAPTPPVAPEAPAEPAPRTEEKPTSDWFAPRKSGAGKGTQGAAPPTARVCPAVRVRLPAVPVALPARDPRVRAAVRVPSVVAVRDRAAGVAAPVAPSAP